ncbi:MAG: AlkZ family DNA glycosylase [Caldilineaceae bacterium]|nr:AlkZ family DNA glycosylase [Caldilineaceae bacterium]
MDFREIARRRMDNQGLVNPTTDNPIDVVAWQGAVQAQEYAFAKWAVAQRTTGMNDAQMEQAFTDGTILRTHVMRPTWHFVTPADIRWMLVLTAPRVNQVMGSYYRAHALDDATFRRSSEALTRALAGGKHLTRAELATALQHAGIVTDGLRLGFLVMRAELDALICSGPRRGKQFTYALLEERVPPAKSLARDEALAELTKRYFQSHGPALIKDFVWWSGLTVADAKQGIEMLKPQLQQEVVNGQSYWFADSPAPAQRSSPATYLLPVYDEALASFKDYSAAVPPQFEGMWDNSDRIFSHYVVIDGQIVGSWKRTFAKGAVVIEFKSFATWSDAETEAIHAEAQRFADFLGMPLALR